MDQVLDFLMDLFRSSDFKPLWQIGSWTSFHGWLYIISDLLIWAAYFIIPLIVSIYIRRQGRKTEINNLHVVFAVFLLAGGATYLVDALTFWEPMMRFAAFIRFVTALASWITIYYLIKVLPKAFALKTPRELQEEVEKRHKVENEMRIKHERLLDAERTARLGYGYWDITKQRVELSEMACSILGITPSVILTYDKMMEQVHPADMKFAEDCMKKNLKAKTFKEFYFRVVSRHMVVKHVLIKGEVERNARGEAIMVKGTIQDVSELRKHMQRIELQNKRLKKIAWVQSHRMRSPVATMLGMVELFNFSDPADPMNAEILSNIKELTEKLDGMIHEVDDLTREKVR
jgi:PAS domain-containing protein